MAFSTAKPSRTGQGSLWHSDKQDKKITALVSMMLIVSNKCGKSAARLAFFVIGRRIRANTRIKHRGGWGRGATYSRERGKENNASGDIK